MLQLRNIYQIYPEALESQTIEKETARDNKRLVNIREIKRKRENKRFRRVYPVYNKFTKSKEKFLEILLHVRNDERE